jgi:hypothetical protein
MRVRPARTRFGVSMHLFASFYSFEINFTQRNATTLSILHLFEQRS